MTSPPEAVGRVVRAVRTEILLTAWQFGLYVPPDRKVLDEVILPFYARERGFERMLFVGVKTYNAKNRALFQGRSYATIDPNPAFARHGGSPHFVAGLENVAAHFDPGSLDVIVVNGVLGHGLNEPPLVERALEGCHRALRAAGELVLGVNEEAPGAVDLGSVKALRCFAPATFPPLGTERHVVPTPLRERTHTFLFYRRA